MVRDNMVTEKHGWWVAIGTIILVAIALLVQLGIIAKWTGAIDEQTKAQCRRIEMLETFQQTAPKTFVTKEEHTDIKERLNIQREFFVQAVKDFKDGQTEMSKKIDKQMEMLTQHMAMEKSNGKR